MKSSIVCSFPLFSLLLLAVVHAQQATQPVLLGEEYASPANGIALKPPVDCRNVITAVPGLVAEFDSDDHGWFLKIQRLSLPNPSPLTVYNDQFGQQHDGLLEQTAKQLQNQGLVTVVSESMSKTGTNKQVPVGLLVLRRQDKGERRFSQQALVQANDQLYYVIELSTPDHSNPAAGTADPDEQRARDTFTGVVDSVRLLDRAAIFHDQAERLIRTRGLFANWTPTYLTGRLIPQQYFRLIHDGRDIGYTYEMDEFDDRAGKIADSAIVRISIRSGSRPDDKTDVEAQSRLIVTVDRKHEIWVNIAELTLIPPAAPGGVPGTLKQSQISEVGSSDQRTHAVAAVPAGGGLDAAAAGGAGGAGANPIQPGITVKDSWSLTVVRKALDASVKQSGPPFKADAPPFYLPQALSYMLPRLLPFKEPKTYMFAAYVSDGDHGMPAVMSRYVEVQPPMTVELDGQRVVAVPVRDQLGLQGPITMHYLNPDSGAFLGTVAKGTDRNGKETVDMILPTDAVTLKRLWPNCNLTRPDKIVDEAPTP
jgi:hypothetical protein